MINIKISFVIGIMVSKGFYMEKNYFCRVLWRKIDDEGDVIFMIGWIIEVLVILCIYIKWLKIRIYRDR